MSLGYNFNQVNLNEIILISKYKKLKWLCC